MKLSLETLYEQGGFAGEPVQRTITYKVNGVEVSGDVWVRKLSYQSAIGDLKALSGDEQAIAAARIANCIVDDEGHQMYQVADITGFYEDGTPVLNAQGKPRGGFVESLLHALWSAIAEVNNMGKTQTD
jgi:hypothetical protein